MMRQISIVLILVLLAGCGASVSSRPCPRVTEFPASVQAEMLGEFKAANDAGVQMTATWRMMNAMAADRAANRAICPR